ncbi:MAG: xanthine dehydrogenase family protein molybdopterin-binding subunit [Hyphomonadaceae bacterium]|nr:xanthine dehydrogenase family protein molybdopterin-binding subunit [Hyphomonadaceae bacterium]
MADTATFSPSRRFVIAAIGVGTAGFAVGCDTRTAAAAGPVTLTSLGDYVRVGSDNTITVYLRHIEFGQGVSTGLTTIVAEEIDADWSQMRFEHSPADNAKYGNAAFGGMMGTGGSTAIFSSWGQLRAAGASAREMLRQAAAKKFGVDASEVLLVKGKAEAGGKSATYGELAVEASAITPPDPATLKYKDASAYAFIGKERDAATGYGRLDTPDKVHAKAQYALDYHVEGALTALLTRSPKFGGKVASFDATEAKAVAGVTDVVQISNGVAVLATNFWAAKKGRDALKITWDDSAAEKRSTDAIIADYKKALAKPGMEARKEGAGVAGLTGAGEVITADFEFPSLVHAPMEPLNCTITYKPGESCTIHSGSQMPTGDQAAACSVLGLKPEQVVITTLLAGGSFGRRATPDADLVSEAAQIAKVIEGKAPVKLMWTREDDIRSGKYRPMAVHRMTARINNGAIEAWGDRTAIQSIMEGTPFLPPGAPDFSSIEGSNDIAYAIPNISVDVHLVKSPVSVLWWRSVGHTHTAYAKEHFFDVAARKAGKDPVELRRALLAKDPRQLGVLNLAIEKAGPVPAGKTRGVAVHHSFSSYVAEVADVTVNADGTFHVDRVVCAVDCGIVINPDIVRSQMEGGIGYGLSAILGEALTIKDGAPVQTNFYDYNVLRMAQMPKIEVHIVPSTEPPTGVGEPGVPPIGPAVANALLASTGKTYSKLPLGLKA